ncbi:phenoxazinone synthase [Massilia eurypsychrophila]|jgi:4a-hydroxytetrahydrobiopterin dehydratase|uniref:Putative pterin-4-alpha-carbinolamine dehydratase n=1 Tax=Massilia eurypsychrophila TaxID=1485217 RepID=A0A2G8TF63_9BURK|nr:4a-hydroxytetrahydrobiopterin dehydratase [Massilia eurypsychrophila]PIL44686.1 phenoxazinone synthase [Massilia eurypsychrophila]
MTLLDQHCIEGAPALGQSAIDAALPDVPGWSIEDGYLRRNFAFRDYHETIKFVNSLAEMVHQQDHHPLLSVTYKNCVVSYHTHSAGGALSQNDFICAAKANAIYALRAGA